jgi:FkbM family methyltransferase
MTLAAAPARAALDTSDLAVIDITINGHVAKYGFRQHSMGDLLATEQVFQKVCYRIDNWAQGRALLKYGQQLTRPLIVDAGANIGAASVFFLNLFDTAVVFAIEPEARNAELLRMNTGYYGSRAFAFSGAIASQDGRLFLSDPGKTDMGFRTWERKAADASVLQEVQSISPATIFAHPSVVGSMPFIFKIDIEGAEADLFDGDTTWMREFPLIIIELHDWMLPFSGSSQSFLKAAAAHEWDFVYSGENIFLFNRPLLQGWQ